MVLHLHTFKEVKFNDINLIKFNNNSELQQIAQISYLIFFFLEMALRENYTFLISH